MWLIWRILYEHVRTHERNCFYHVLEDHTFFLEKNAIQLEKEEEETPLNLFATPLTDTTECICEPFRPKTQLNKSWNDSECVCEQTFIHFFLPHAVRLVFAHSDRTGFLRSKNILDLRRILASWKKNKARQLLVDRKYNASPISELTITVSPFERKVKNILLTWKKVLLLVLLQTLLQNKSWHEESGHPWLAPQPYGRKPNLTL